MSRLKGKRRALALAVAGAFLCAPVTLTAWRWRDLPQFGAAADDGIYWVTAKALAEGRGYRIESLPGEPWQTKYPPLYPAYLALAWKINPEFPANLALGVLLTWLWAPPLLLLSFLTYRKLGVTASHAVVLTALFALNSWFLHFASGIYSEVPYTVLLLATVLVLERAGGTDSFRLPLAAGLLAGAAFLCRTVGIAVVASGAVGLLLARRARGAVIYLAGALPAPAAWIWWTQSHKYAGSDPGLIYHTDYLRFYLGTVRLEDLPVLLWGNLGGTLIRGGNLIVPTPGETAPERVFWIIVAVLAFMGVIRLARRIGLSHYHLYAAGHLLLLLPWNFPANSRLLFPLAPLLMAGLLEEVRHVAGMAASGLRRTRGVERFAARTMLATLAALGAVGAWRWARPLGEHYPQLSERYRRQLRDVEDAYRRVRETTPSDATVLAWQDSLLYLKTARKGAYLGPSPVPWYTMERSDVVRHYLDGIAEAARAGRRDYVLLTSTEFLITDPEELQEARKVLAVVPHLREVYASPNAVLYEVLPSPAIRASSAPSADDPPQ